MSAPLRDRAVSRRGVLAGGAALALAGCAGPDHEPGPPSGLPGASRSAAGVGVGTGSGSGSGSGAGSAATAHDWDLLRRSVAGTLARPGDPAYDRVRLLQNPRYDAARPLAVLSVASAVDVATGLAFARDHGLPVAIRSGGHSYPGWSAGNGRLVVDVRPLAGVRLSGTSATVGAGAPLVRVYDELGRRGRGIAGGSCPTVGIGGLTQGGGVGVVSRAHGLTCDAVTSMRVVTAAGHLVTASHDHEPDLYWALRGGGGGHLGVVTSFTFDTFAAPDISTVYLQWPLSAGPTVVPVWQSWAPVADARLWSTLKALSGAVHAAGPVLALSATWTGPDAGFASRLAGLLDHVPAPTVRVSHRRSYRDTMLAYAGCATIPVDACHTGPGGALPREAFVATSHVAYDPLTPTGVSTLVDRVARAQGSGLKEAGISLDALGGRVGDLGPADTAFVHRRALATVQYTATYTSGGPAAASDFVHGARAALTPDWGNHAYVNYADPTLEHYRQAYFGANAARLAQVRDAYDPDGFFTQPQSW